MSRRDSYPVAHREERGQALGPVEYATVPGMDLASRVAAVRGFLRRRFWLIVVCFVPCVGLAAAYSYLAPRTYESGATFLLEAHGSTGAGSSLELLDRRAAVD